MQISEGVAGNAIRVRKKITLIAVVLFILSIIILSNAQTTLQYVWFAYDAHHTNVFLVSYRTQAQLFLVAFVISFAVLSYCLAPIKNMQGIFTAPPEGRDRIVALFLQFVEQKGQTVAKWIAAAISFLFATGFAACWKDFLLLVHQQSFHRTDPIFGLDFGFYVFQLPFINDLLSSLLNLLFVAGLITTGLQFLRSGVLNLTQIAVASKSLRPRIVALLGSFLVVLSFYVWISQYEITVVQNSQFTGAGYSDFTQLMATRVLAIGVLILAIAVLANLVQPKLMKFASGLAGALAVFWLVGCFVAPALVQRFRVDPDKLHVESPFAVRAIQGTYFGYNLENLTQKEFSINNSPTPDELASSQSTLQNMRLWDWNVFQQTSDGIQGLKPYYHFADIDVDRYNLPDGKGNFTPTVMMVGARSLNQAGLSDSAKTWVNTKLVYTHGYGLVMAPANQADSMGQPVYTTKDIPVSSIPGVQVTEPRVYFSDFDSSADGSNYVVVNTKVNEFDYATDTGSATNRWQGTRGIPVDQLPLRLLSAVALGDGNLLVSGNIQPDSRLLIHRNIVSRAKLIYPFLQFDSDPYLTVIGGRMVWIMDGYTTSDAIPYSQETSFAGQTVNYIRNSVKVVIDAYTGESVAYQMDANDPLLNAYKSIYKGLITSLSEAPKELVAHFRYPEELYALQSEVLTQYHATDPQVFLSGTDAWAIPNERGLNGETAQLEPYYVEMRLPDEPIDGFMLIRPFTPYGRDNMSGWLAAHCDPANYGKLILYRFTKGSLIAGPAQEESLFVQDRTVADINRNYNNDQSQIIVGDLLVIPIGHSIMYAESLFLEGRTSGIRSIPELKKVILATRDKIVVEDTYQQALQSLFGNRTASPPAPQIQPGKNGSGVGSVQSTAPAPLAPLAELGKIRTLFEQGKSALRNGDFATYGKIEKQIEDELSKIPSSK